MISHIDNFITRLLDVMYDRDAEYLFLETGKNPYSISQTRPVFVVGFPGSDPVDSNELIEDMEALGMIMAEEEEYYYRHRMDDASLPDMRMVVISKISFNGDCCVYFRRLQEDEIAKPSKGKRFEPSPYPPTNAHTRLGFL
jgi:hypothetical protein